jgi:hypothetical protein
LFLLGALFWIRRFYLSSEDSAPGPLTLVADLLGMLAACAVGAAFWTLSDWARLVIIGIAVLPLVAGGSSEEIWERIECIVVIWYLMSPGVKSAFRAAAKGGERPEIVGSWFVKSPSVRSAPQQ